MSNHDFSVDCDIRGEARQHKNMSAFVYQRYESPRYSVERRRPRPYPYTKFAYPAGKSIARIPSVIGTVPTGMMRTLSPQRISVEIDSQNRSLPEWRYGEIQIAPSQKARLDARRLLPVRPQKVQPFRIIGEIQNRVARFMRGR